MKKSIQNKPLKYNENTKYHDIKCSQVTEVFVTIEGIWHHLSTTRRLQVGLLLATMLISGFAEILSLGAIVPFILALNQPEKLLNVPILREICNALNYNTLDKAVLLATFLFVVAVVLAAFVRVLNIWLNNTLAGEIGADLSCEAYRRTLYQPYDIHMSTNTSALIATSTSQVNRAVSAIGFFFQLITSLISSSFIIIGLLLVNFKVSVYSIAAISCFYLILAFSTKQRLSNNSKTVAKSVKEQVKSLQESLGHIRDVILDAAQESFVTAYRSKELPQRRLMAQSKFLSEYPRYVIEAVGLVGLAFFAGSIAILKGTTNDALAVIGVLALGAQKLLPMLQRIYSSWSRIEALGSDLSDVLSRLQQPMPTALAQKSKYDFQQDLKLDNIYFRYSNDKKDVLKGLSLTIRKGQCIGLMGASGCGKSTMADLIMGLLVPDSGRILIDNKDLHNSADPEFLQAWRQGISHVPQNVYLADITIAENIAWGLPTDEIDFDRLEWSADLAQVSEFIHSLPLNYFTRVGEQGVFLSGGQRQRIGLARAFYKESNLLILDEATSALDTRTEEAVVDAMGARRHALTTIMITHRASTLRYCDEIITFEDGNISSKSMSSQ